MSAPRQLNWFAVILSLCVPFGCSKAKAPGPRVSVSVANVGTNASGEILLQLSLTNLSASAVLVAARSTIHQAQASWVTNFNLRPRFVGSAGPGSEVSDLTLAAGDGTTVALLPLRMVHPFQIEFVCFPGRTGVAGMVDNAKDKIKEFRDGSGHESYLGDSFFVVTPLIYPITKPGTAANGSKPSM